MSLTDAVTLLEALKSFPQGATPRQIAERLGRSQDAISARLGKLAMYDVIDRCRVDVPEHRCIAYRYSTRAAHV